MSESLSESGYALLASAVTAERASQVGQEIERLYRDVAGGRISGKGKQLVGGRNLQDHWRGWAEICAAGETANLLREIFETDFGLVRILYFDKPPGQSWNLSLHRDRTIAVERHHEPPEPYSRPTRKAGVPHVVADDALLSQMLTLRLHLDAMHADNGPLTVVPGSHRGQNENDPREIHCEAGDLFVMRPLLLHGSRLSSEGCGDHRRVVHLELAPRNALASPYRWHRYDAVTL